MHQAHLGIYEDELLGDCFQNLSKCKEAIKEGIAKSDDPKDTGVAYDAVRTEVGMCMDQLVTRLGERRADSTDLEWKAFVDLSMRHPLRELVHEDPFTHRAFAKPRGYAGDAELLDFIYGVDEGKQAPRETPLLGQMIFSYTTNSPACQGVRERARLVAEVVDRMAMQISQPKILSVAAGHMREAELTGALRQKRIGRWVGMDHDSESVQEINRSYGRFGVEGVVGTVRQLVTRKLNLGEFDFIYSMGLYDYLQQPLAQRLTERLFEMLRPGGQLVIGNFQPGIKDRGYMESYMAWQLEFRSQTRMLDLAMSINGALVEDIRLLGEDNQNVIFLQVTKDRKPAFRTSRGPATSDSGERRIDWRSRPKASGRRREELHDARKPDIRDNHSTSEDLQNLLGDLYNDEVLSESYTLLNAGQVEAGMQKLAKGLHERYLNSSEQEWNRFLQLSRFHPIRKLLHEDPLTELASKKQLGYTSDAKLLDCIYGAEQNAPPPEGTTDLGREIFHFTTHTSLCDGVCNRLRVIAEELDRAALEISFPAVLSLASGHLHEATLCGAVRQGRIGRWVAFDPDKDSLLEVQRLSFGVEIEICTGTIRQLLSGEIALGEFDFIYSAGWYDYLDEAMAKRLTARLVDLLRPGGQLLVTGLLPDIPTRGYMESFMDWHLEYRSPPEMLDLAELIDPSRINNIRLWTDDPRVVQFLQIKTK
ncbi:MAG: class I SAM-dependent methyltransferase [Pirellulaceae bacterium]|nr:class I SAM-dependent methyltransferase [Pirellulaceae bacterium]